MLEPTPGSIRAVTAEEVGAQLRKGGGRGGQVNGEFVRTRAGAQTDPPPILSLPRTVPRLACRKRHAEPERHDPLAQNMQGVGGISTEEAGPNHARIWRWAGMVFGARGRTGGITTPRSIWERINQQATSDEGKTIKGGEFKWIERRTPSSGSRRRDAPGRRQNTNTVLETRDHHIGPVRKIESTGAEATTNHGYPPSVTELWR